MKLRNQKAEYLDKSKEENNNNKVCLLTPAGVTREEM